MHKFCITFLMVISSAPLFAQVENLTGAIEIKVYPMQINEDSFALGLLPDENQLKDGNAAPVLLRLIYEQQNYMTKIAPNFPVWLDRSFDDNEMRNSIRFDRFFKQLKRAAYIRDAEWNYPINEEPMIEISLPDVQSSRIFVGRGLSLFARKAVADNNPELAQECILVGLACARHYARTPFLVCQLTSIATSRLLLDQADVLIQHENSANLYWAYEKLPQPLFDLADSISLEKNLIRNSIPLSAKDPWPTHDETDKWATIASQIANYAMAFRNEPQNAFNNAAMLQKLYAFLRANWGEIGDETKGEVDQMCNEELAARFYFRKAGQVHDRFKTALRMDPRNALKLIVETNLGIEKMVDEIGVPPLKKFFLNPINYYVAAWRPTRKVIVLQTIEALRHYAATHDGKLPESLTEITDVPVPVDPFTGKSVGYKLSKDVATIIMINPNLIIGKTVNRIELKYQVTITK